MGHRPSAPKQGEIAAAQLDKAKLETKEAAQSMREYAYAEKAEFVNKMQKELVDIQGELDRLGAKVDRASGAAKVDGEGQARDGAREMDPDQAAT